MAGKHSKPRAKKRPSDLILNLCILFFIGLMVYSLLNIFIWLRENSKTKKIEKTIESSVIIDETKEKNDRYEITFSDLKKINSDSVAWIKVPNTNIEYPIVKSSDNAYYLNHSFDKTDNKAGWIFMDYTNKMDGTDKNIVIYGHNRKDKSMFGTLKNILTEEWYNNEDNYEISFITENSKDIYKVFSVYRIEKEDYYIKTSFADGEFKEFVKTIKARSKKDFGIDVSENDTVLTLSTCDNNNKYRVVLHAKKM